MCFRINVENLDCKIQPGIHVVFVSNSLHQIPRESFQSFNSNSDVDNTNCSIIPGKACKSVKYRFVRNRSTQTVKKSQKRLSLLSAELNIPELPKVPPKTYLNKIKANNTTPSINKNSSNSVTFKNRPLAPSPPRFDHSSPKETTLPASTIGTYTHTTSSPNTTQNPAPKCQKSVRASDEHPSENNTRDTVRNVRSVDAVRNVQKNKRK